jgi:hypothetical protein
MTPSQGARAIVAALLLSIATRSEGATIVLSPGAGFGDTTPIAPAPGNPGTTLGQQRTHLFNAAAAVWAAKLSSSQTITIEATFETLPCSAGSGVLGSAGPTTFFVLSAGGDERFFPVALAEAIESDDLNEGDAEIFASFNSRIDLADTGCLGNTRWYYGLTGPAPAGTIALFPTVLHELGHGLGFLTLICDEVGGCDTDPGTPPNPDTAQGAYFFGIPDIWSEFLRDNSGSNEYWVDMTNAERIASSTDDPRLVWDGPLVTARLAALGLNGAALNEERLRMYAPSPYEPGSSVSHFHEDASPNLLMEPTADADVFNQTDLTDCLFGDIGWIQSGCGGNSAPVLDASRAPALAAIAEDAGAASGAVGTLVSSLVDFASPSGQLDNVTDADAGAQLGIAVVAADVASGSWFFSTNNGGAWSGLGSVSASNARLLAADAGTRLYFRPNPDFDGTLASAITFRAWDRTSGTAGSSASTTPNGASTAYSSATDTAVLTVTASNDAPVLDAARNPVLAAVLEDASAPSGSVGTLVSALIDFATPAGQLDNLVDVDTAALAGIAVTAADVGQGVWFYSLNNGGSWSALGAVSNGNARLLAADAGTRLYFRPSPDFSGGIAGALTFRAWDRSSGSAGTLASTTSNGGGNAFSSATDTAALSVSAVNDAPVLDTARAPQLDAVAQNAPAPVGAVGSAVSSLVDFALPAGQLDNVTDLDAGALLGIAIVALDEGDGRWFFSVDAGANWSPLDGVSVTAARLLAADAATRVYFRPDPGFEGRIAAALTFRAWDRSNGAAGGFANTTTSGGTTAYSGTTDTAAIEVEASGALFRDGFE